MKAALLQSNYIPWKGNFDLIRSVDVYVIYDEVQYTKNDWRNRNLIKDNQGNLQWLTIPVRVESSSQSIADTTIPNPKWKKKHWRSIAQNYAKSAYFKTYGPILENLYDTCPDGKLSDVNRHFLYGICRILGIETKIIDSKELSLTGDRQEKIVDMCKKLDVDTYLSGPAAKSYIETSLFTKNKVSVEWMDYSRYPKYQQCFGDFRHDVSIIDLLLNTGPNSSDYMLKLGD